MSVKVGNPLCANGYEHRDYVRSVVRKAPPLTVEQRDRIGALLRAGAPPEGVNQGR